MRIVIDANIFCADFRLAGNAFRILMAGTQRVGRKLVVPQLVIDEVANKFRERVVGLVQQVEKLSRDSNRILGRGLEIGFQGDKVDQEVEAYRAFLNRSLLTAGTEVLPYPTVSHEELVRQALAREKPFGRGEAGYRDALIWQSVIECLKTKNEPLSFVTANSKDFCDGSTLSQDLVKSLEAIGLSDQYVRLYTSLEELTQETIIPTLKRLDEMVERFQSDKWEGFSLRKWVEVELIKELKDGDLEELMGPLVPGHGHTSLNLISEVCSVNVDDVRLLQGNEVILSSTTNITAVLGLSADWDDYLRHEDVRNWFSSEGEQFTWASMDLPVSLKVSLSLIFDTRKSNVLSCEINTLDSDYGTVTINSHPRRPS